MYGVILAAGAGGRMGGAKARLIVAGTPLGAAHAARLREAGCDGVVMVVREEDVSVVPPGTLAAVSGAPEPAGSLLVGLKAVPASADVLVITPVDVIPARPDTIRALVRALDALDAPVLAATPVSKGQGGHPVVVRRAALDRLTPNGSLRDLLADLGPQRVRVETDDPAILTDLDDPDDVVAQTGAPPAFIPR